MVVDGVVIVAVIVVAVVVVVVVVVVVEGVAGFVAALVEINGGHGPVGSYVLNWSGPKGENTPLIKARNITIKLIIFIFLFHCEKRRRSYGNWSLVKIPSGGAEFRQNGRRRLKLNFSEYKRLLQLKSLNVEQNNFCLSETFLANHKNGEFEILQKNVYGAPISLMFFPSCIL